jgi:hypothetical protein
MEYSKERNERGREREKKMNTCKMTRKRKERTMKTFVCLS